MTTLSDSEILEFLREKKLVITNLPADNIQLGSVDLTLGKTVEVVTGDAPIDIEAISKEELKQPSWIILDLHLFKIILQMKYIVTNFILSI